MTEEIAIRRYKEDDHEAVRRIFSSGIKENYKTGIYLGLQSPRVIGILAAMLAVGSFHSILLGISLLCVAMVLYSSLIYFCYYEYVRDHLNTDMADKALPFWTTPPNVFLVATSSSTKHVLGCISYRKIAEDTVEMHRLAADSKARGLGVGMKLVKALFETAKENGFKKLYLETSSPQLAAINIYDRMNFSVREDKKFGVFLYDLLSGLNIVAFTYKLQ